MNTTVNTNRENMNAANMGASNKINDFGQKIGGARKDLYQAANEWAEKLADITAEALTKAGGVSKLVRLPNLESMAAAGAISADQARAALVIWRGIERKPQGRYRADRWAERTRARLEAAAAIITGTEPTTDEVADIIKTARESAEFAVITAANWPADPFTFGNYTVKYYIYSEPQKLRIIGGHYYRGEASTDPADIARQLREMTAADAEKAAESRAAGPRLGVYHTSDYTRYFIAVENKCEIVLKVCDTYQEATEAARNERAELLAKYEALRTFPALRRAWNRPRIGKEWHAEDVTPEQFAAAIPFKGVEFGNWLNQDERAALLNSAFDGFHDLADLLGIPAAAVSLGGMLNFSFATRGHAGSAAHFDSMYNTINLNKRNGAGCMAHEWLHACDHFAAVLAGRGSCTSWGEAFATECNKESDHPADIAARELVAAIRKMDYYTRSRNYQIISGKSQGGADYYTQPCELAARGFEGVILYLLNCAGGCSDFLVNLQSWRDFERDDAGHRRDCYPYPSDAEAAALLPYYMAFFCALFGSCEVSQKAAEGVAAATLQAQQEKAEADRRAQEKAEQERKESEERRAARRAELDRKAEEQRKENERKAAEIKAKAEATRAAIVERLTAAHFDTIATDCDEKTVYFAAHLEGEIYTGKVEIKSDPAEIAATVQAAPVACLQYKYIHNAKRVICRRWQVASVRSNKRTARELLASLKPSEVRDICRTFVDFERAENWQKAARIYSDTQRTREELNKRAQKPANEPTANEPTESATTAQGLTMEKYSEKATVIRGYNADQLAELLAMGGKEWRNLKGGKGVIFSTRRHGDELAAWMEQQAGEGTTAPATDQPAETLPEWATEGARATILRNGEQLRGYITEIHKTFRGKRYTCTFNELGTLFNTRVNVSDCAPVEDPAAVLPEWLTVGARVRTRGRYMLNARNMRREWVEGEEMTVKEINADFVRLENRNKEGIITSSQSIATEQAAAELSPIYSPSEKSQPAEIEPAAIAASIDTNEPEPAATFETSATAEEQQQADALPFMEKAAILDKVQARIFAPWGDVCRRWLVPFRGALDVWNAWARNFGAEGCERLSDWALTAKVGERAECRGLMVQIWERDGQTAAEPTTEPDRLKANRETRERLRAAIVAELEAADVYIYPFNNEMKIICKVLNAEQLYKVQDIARRYTSAQFRHDEGDRVCEFVLPLFFPHFFPTDPTPEPSGEGKGETVTLQDGETCAASAWIAYAPMHLDDLKKGYSVYDVYDTENEAREDLQKALEMWRRRGNVIEHTGDYWFTWIDREKGRRHLHFICTAPTNWQARAAEILATLPTDPTPEPSGEGVAVCHSYETGATLQEAGEIKPAAKAEPTRNQEIAKIILQQLGGRQFAMMTGAKQFVAIDNGVRFRIGKNKTRANLVKIVLRGDDTYNMEFWHIGQEVNPYTILMRYADKGLSPDELNKQVRAATERAEKAAEPVKLKAYEGIYCDQLQDLFTEYTELYTRLF